jgi:hypothetical protein
MDRACPVSARQRIVSATRAQPDRTKYDLAYGGSNAHAFCRRLVFDDRRFGFNKKIK